MAVTDVLLTLAITCVLALAVERPHRVGGARRRPRRLGEVSGRDRGRARGRGGVGEVAGARPRGRARDRRVRAHEPVRADPRRIRLGRHLPRAAARPRRLARVRERPGRAARVSRPALGRRRPAAARRGRRRRGGSDSPHEDRPHPALVRDRLLADADAATGPLRALHAAARSRPGRPRGERPGGGAVRARGARRSRSRGASPTRASSRAPTPACGPMRGSPRTSPRGDTIAADPSTLPLTGRRRGPARAARARTAVRSRARPGPAAREGVEVGDRLGRGHRPRARGVAAAIRARRRSTSSSRTARSPPSPSSRRSRGSPGPWVRVYRL